MTPEPVPIEKQLEEIYELLQTIEDRLDKVMKLAEEIMATNKAMDE
jgi:hypothetical protein